ncbi:MAG: FG-GAP-like repeat-containing protein [candidate division WOR-3 bacterium]
MKKVFSIVILLVMDLMIVEEVNSLVFYQYAYLDKGDCSSLNSLRQKDVDYNRNGRNELILNNYAILFYEYSGNNDFNLIKEVFPDPNYPYIMSLGIGDFDGDSLKDIIVWKTGSYRLWIYEQSERTSFFDSLVWISDTIYKSLHYLGITDKLKHDGVERIYGAGIPWLTTPSKAYGWYYYTCTGDNQYEIRDTFMEETRVGGAMDIGDIDKDGLTDIIITSPNNYLYFYESADLMDTCFIKKDSLTEGGYAPLQWLILPDIDDDGVNEIIKSQIYYLQPVVGLAGWVSYGYAIMEDTIGTGVYDTIWSRDFLVWTDYIYSCGGGMDYGDVDGDGGEELVICGGRHIEVWKGIGDNELERIWEWTDPTNYTTESCISCYDFNRNGIEEIIFSGCGLTGNITRVIEGDPERDPEAPEMVKADASDGMVVGEGVDYDDYIRIEFGGLTNEPKIDKSNIDSILRLSGGHSYLANGRYLDTCRWEIEGGKSVLYIELTEIISKPTVMVGDTIYPDGVTIRSFEYPTYAISEPIVISGSFGPTGIGEEELLVRNVDIEIEILKQNVIWNTKGRGVLVIYDISGREIIREGRDMLGEYKTDISGLKNGIYFVKLQTGSKTITRKIVLIK